MPCLKLCKGHSTKHGNRSTEVFGPGVHWRCYMYRTCNVMITFLGTCWDVLALNMLMWMRVRTRCDVGGAIKHVVGAEAGSEATHRLITVTRLYAGWCSRTSAAVLYYHGINDVSRHQMWDLYLLDVMKRFLLQSLQCCSNLGGACLATRMCRTDFFYFGLVFKKKLRFGSDWV